MNPSRHCIAYALVGLCLGLLPLPSEGAGLTGTSVTGTLKFGSNTNYYDPANGYVPMSGYLNSSSPTVTVASPAVEFGFNDNVNLDTANFSALQFTLEDTVEAGPFDSPLTMTFTDSAFVGMSLSKVSDFFPNGGLTFSLSGNTVTINWAGGAVATGDDYTSTFTLKAVPEPSTWAAFGVGVLTLLVVTRRKLA